MNMMILIKHSFISLIYGKFLKWPTMDGIICFGKKNIMENQLYLFMLFQTRSRNSNTVDFLYYWKYIVFFCTAFQRVISCQSSCRRRKSNSTGSNAAAGIYSSMGYDCFHKHEFMDIYVGDDFNKYFNSKIEIQSS